MTDLETVRAQHRVTAACRGRDAPTDTSDPFLQTSIRDAVTRRILGVIRAGAASMPRRSPGREAVGRRRTGTRTASTSERTEDLDRASAGRERGRQANPVVGGRDVGRERHGGDDATVAVPTMRIFGPAFLADCAGRPKPTTKATHAHNMQRSIAGLRQPSRRCGHCAQRAELVRRSVGHASGYVRTGR